MCRRGLLCRQGSSLAPFVLVIITGRNCTLLFIQRTPYSETPTIEDVRVDLGGLDALMAQELLDRPDVVPRVEQVGGEGMPEGMGGGVGRELGSLPRNPYRLLDHRWVSVWRWLIRVSSSM